ncbi:protein of unknown function [Paraburkholderia dioscoreae]|uniref:Uncharacterized protein n=1 Tax=Paraburkholderia dioscoreae TaxID=2604047 RepID=A0A5Q4ZEW5_9BURK|nr:protein of unknown function [Paraburkholderia dioscoreae]
MQVRYQAALRPEQHKIITDTSFD